MLSVVSILLFCFVDSVSTFFSEVEDPIFVGISLFFEVLLLDGLLISR